MDLMNLLYQHQIALIRAADLPRAGIPRCTGKVAELAELIQLKRSNLGVQQYLLGCAA